MVEEISRSNDRRRDTRCKIMREKVRKANDGLECGVEARYGAKHTGGDKRGEQQHEEDRSERRRSRMPREVWMKEMRKQVEEGER